MDLHYIREQFHHNKARIILFCFCVVCILISCFYCIRFIITPHTGLMLKHPQIAVVGDRLIFRTGFPFSHAVEEGLVSGQDIIKRINNRDIRSVRNFIDTIYHIDIFHKFPVDVLRENSGFFQLTIDPRFNLLRMDWILIIICSLFMGYTGFHLLFNHHHIIEYRYITIFAFLCMIQVCVQPFYYKNIITFFLGHSEVFALWAFFHFILMYIPDVSKKKTYFSLSIGLLCLYLGYFFLRLFLFGIWTTTYENKWYGTLVLTEKIKYISDAALYSMTIIVLMTARNNTRIKKQIDWIVSGFILGFGPLFFFEQLPMILENISLQHMSLDYFSYFFLLLFTVFFIVSVSNQPENIQKKQFQLSLLSIIIIAVNLFLFVLFLTPLHVFFSHISEVPETYSLVLSAFSMFVLFLPLSLFLLKIAEKLYYKHTLAMIPSSIALLQRNYTEIQNSFKELKDQFNAKLQSEKLRDLSRMIQGMISLYQKALSEVDRGCIILKNRMSSLLKGVSGNTNDHRGELVKKMKHIEHSLFMLNKGYVNCQNLCKRFSLLMQEHPSLIIWIDCVYIVKNAINEIKKRFTQIEFVTYIDRSIKLYCQPPDIIKAITFILENAVEALPSEAGTITVRALKTDREITIEITDRGCGIPTTNHAKLFEPFYTKKDNHLGLGLFMSKILIEKNNGSVEIRGSKKRTCVAITFHIPNL